MEKPKRDVITYIEKVQGMGPITSKLLYEKLLAAGLLEKNKEISEDNLRDLLKTEKIYKDLPIVAQKDLEYNPLKVVPRELITKFETVMKKTGLQYFIGGSYSRGLHTSGDIDLIITDNWEKVFKKVNKITKAIQITPPVSLGPEKLTSYVCFDEKTYVHMDVFFCKQSEYWVPMVFYVTGNGRFNLLVRGLAKRKGLILNQYGIFRKTENGNEKLPVNSDKDIFEILGMEYRKPEKRNV